MQNAAQSAKQTFSLCFFEWRYSETLFSLFLCLDGQKWRYLEMMTQTIEFDDESYCLLHLETHQQTLIMKWWKRQRTAAENVFLCYDRSRFSDSFTVYSVTKQPTNFFYFLFTPAGSCPVCVTGHGMCVIRCAVWMEIISETLLVGTVLLFLFLVF